MKTFSSKAPFFYPLRRILLIAALCSTAFLFSCTGNEECVNGVMTVTYDPNNNPCKTDCECNNLKFEGHCVNSRCLSFSRKPIDTTDKFLHCRLFYPIKTCVWGLRDPKPDPIKEELWGDCRYYEVGPEDTKDKCIDGKDNDCNGRYDSSEPSCAKYCKDTSQTRSCYEGPAGTANQGRCRPGLQACETTNEWGSCQNQIVPQEETCNQQDDDCDGNVDEQLANCSFTPCSEGARRPCYPFASGCTRGENDTLACKGVCQTGFQLCRRGFWGACEGMQPPQAEACDQVDNDCDGNVDEGCLCEDGQTQDCFKGPSKTSTGICGQGKQTCQNGRWNSCDGAKEPKTEECNGQDDDCDGQIDENLPSQLCENQKGACSGAFKTCGGERGFLVCTEDEYRRNNSLHAKEEQGTDCDNNDNDCDGKVDEDCRGCRLGTSRSCYEGAQGTENTEPCRRGISLCTRQDNGVFVFGPCVGQVTPQAETCNGQDDDCDGVIDNPSVSPPLCPTGQRCVSGQCLQDGEPAEPNEPVSDAGEPTPDLPPPLCILGTAENCYEGPPGTHTNAPCKKGLRACIRTENGDLAWSECFGQAIPKIEICNGVDDNCDGTIDNDDGQKQLCPPSQACIQGNCVPQEVATEPTGDGGVQPEGLPDGAICTPNKVKACYTGPAGTLGRGVCKEGTTTCQSDGTWGACVDEIKPTTEECNGLDDDCNGTVDDPLLLPVKPCPNQKGICAGSGLACLGKNRWATTCDYSAYNKLYETTETLCDGVDNDCNGLIDEGCAWAAGLSPAFPGNGHNRFNDQNTKKTLFIQEDQQQQSVWLACSPSDWVKNFSFTPTTSSPKILPYSYNLEPNPSVPNGSRPLLLLRKKSNGLVDCSLAQTINPTYSGKTAAYRVKVLPNGEILVYGEFYEGSIQFGNLTLQSLSNVNLFLLKVSATCQPIWLTRIGGTDTGFHSTAITDIPDTQGTNHHFCAAGYANGNAVFFGSQTVAEQTLLLPGQNSFIGCGRLSDGVFVYAKNFQALRGSQYGHLDPIFDLVYDSSAKLLHVQGQACQGISSPISLPLDTESFLAAFSVQQQPTFDLTPKGIYSIKSGNNYACGGNSQQRRLRPVSMTSYALRLGASNQLYAIGMLTSSAALNNTTQQLAPDSSGDGLVMAFDYDTAQNTYSLRWHRQFLSVDQQGAVITGATNQTEVMSFSLDDKENLFITGRFKGYLEIRPTLSGFQRSKCSASNNPSSACVAGSGYDLFVIKLDKQGIFQWGTSTGNVGDQMPWNIALDPLGGFFYLLLYSTTVGANLDYHTPNSLISLWQQPLPKTTP
ncbi:MAG: hypothetical protein H6727_04930 [Myxococcales bacterium]|nr:hypothetical protein [Myxococcales bacterium]